MTDPFTVLVPIQGQKADTLLPLAAAVVERYGGQGAVLSVVEVPEEQSLSAAALMARGKRRLLRRLAEVHDAPEFRVEVRTARSFGEGVQQAVQEGDANLLIVPWTPGREGRWPLRHLAANPPCDMAVVKEGKAREVRSVLLPVRGGPHARLALRLAEAVAAQHGAALTLLYVDLPSRTPERRARDAEFVARVRSAVQYDRVTELEVEAETVEEALLAAGARHDVVVMGAAARDPRSPYLFGRIPETVARRVDSTVIVAKTAEPVTAQTFGLPEPPAPAATHREISQLVDRWFAENTFHSHEFRRIPQLVGLKERQGTSISVVLPTLNEEATVGKIISTIKRNLMDRYPLIDELLVIDSDSEDRTVQIATELGVPVYKHPQILPELSSYRGKGEALWKSLQVARGDIVVWIDSDITGIHPKFVYGLVGPLLTQPHVGFVKGFYRRPLNLGGQLLTTGGGRVTELTARPLINLFYPQLSGLVQPLAGEMAGRREVLEQLPFFTGYGVETGLLIDILDRFGLRSLAQVDLENRVHRNQSLLSLSKMAFAIVQVVVKRLSEREGVDFAQEVSTSMKLIHYSPTELFLEVKEIEEHERPPMITVPEYASRGLVGAL